MSCGFNTWVIMVAIRYSQIANEQRPTPRLQFVQFMQQMQHLRRLVSSRVIIGKPLSYLMMFRKHLPFSRLCLSRGAFLILRLVPGGCRYR